MDTFLNKDYLIVLLEGNEVTVISLTRFEVTFKSTFRDATGTIEKIFYINPSDVFAKNETSVSFSRE